MAFKTLSKAAQGHTPAVTPGGPELVCMRLTQPLESDETDKGVIGYLPAGMVPRMLILHTDNMGTGFVCDLGLADDAGDISSSADDGGKWLDAEGGRLRLRYTSCRCPPGLPLSNRPALIVPLCWT